MNQQERLDLAVRAQVATIWAEQAEEQSQLLRRRAEPFARASERFVKVYGRIPNLKTPGDAATFAGWVRELGGVNVSWSELEAAAAAARECAALSHEAAAAMRELTDAWRDDPDGQGETVLQWIGCDGQTMDRAIEQAMAEATG